MRESGSITTLEEKGFMLQVVGMRIDTRSPSRMDFQGKGFSESKSIDMFVKRISRLLLCSPPC